MADDCSHEGYRHPWRHRRQDAPVARYMEQRLQETGSVSQLFPAERDHGGNQRLSR